MVWLQGKLTQVQTLIQAAAVVMAIIAILGAWFRTKALVPTVTAAVLSGFVLWGIHNTSWFQTKVGQESSLGIPAPAAPAPVIVVIGGPPGPRAA